MLINRTEIKQIAGRLHVTKEFVDELEKVVQKMVVTSCKRATANQRTTLMERDV